MKKTNKKLKAMKKSVINIAVTLAMTAGLYSGSVLNTQAYAAIEETRNSNTDIVANGDTDHDTENSNYLYPGMGAGAAAGLAIAGPAGLVVGGLIGAIVGSNQEAGSEVKAPAEAVLAAESSLDSGISESDKNIAPAQTEDYGLQLAQQGEITPVITDTLNDSQEKLLEILTADFSLDIYFRSGSADVEHFYPARLASIAKLVNSLPQLEIHLDGYSDRRGQRQQNRALANKRIEKVRQQLIDAGLDENRIAATAFGEMKVTSAPGDLEGYTFDRKVVIRFERMTADSIPAMKQALSAADKNTEETPLEAATAADSISTVTANAIAQF